MESKLSFRLNVREKTLLVYTKYVYGICTVYPIHVSSNTLMKKENEERVPTAQPYMYMHRRKALIGLEI